MYHRTVLSFLLLWTCPKTVLAALPAPSATPALVVVVSVDQLRRDRLDGTFTGGLGRLMTDGKVFGRARLDHGVTSTCPGHSVLLTGVNPAKNGIAGNRYIEKSTFRTRYCVEDDDSPVFGADRFRSPKNLRVSALGDWLHDDDPESMVFSVGGKDRATITMAGQHPDGVFWFDTEQGRFTSSRYYMDSLPDWLEAFNGRSPPEDGFLAELPDTWTHPPGSRRVDAFQGEDTEYLNVSGHPLGSGSLQEISEQFYRSPWVDTATIDLAIRLIEEKGLGRDASTDLLAIALSATDTVGHLYGPFSAESEDTLANVDRQLKKLFSHLDEVVGRGRYLVVLSADHGVAELPEWSLANDRMHCPGKSGRTGIAEFVLPLYWNLYWHFTFPLGNPVNLVGIAGSRLTVNRKLASKHDIDVAGVIAYLKSWLEENPVIQHAWTAVEIREGNSETARLLRNSYVEDRSGDLLLVLEPGCLIRDSGTTHGTPWEYDRDIPLVFYGGNIPAGVSEVKAGSVDIAPTLADYLGIPAPSELDGRVLPVD